MALNLYNTLTKKVEPFTPINPGKVGLYTCGPTVYNYAHIGNFRAYLSADILRRTLAYCGYEVTHIMNLTDVDDKTIRDSQANKKSLEEFTVFYANEFKKDSAHLNILPPKTYARAVEHIPQMLKLIETLVDNGHAYITPDGSAYFNVHTDTAYGQLSPVKIIEKIENAGGRIKLDEYEKDNADDFALWKAWDNADGDVFWLPEEILKHETKLAKGRPGWHIECSAMSMEYLGTTFDIHTGGIDLVFPHHENEIAQSECATGKKFVNYWLHNEWVMVEGKKMSKSAGNFATLHTVMEKGINPLAFRLWALMGHYRTSVNFTWDTIEGTANALKRLHAKYLELPEGGSTVESYVNEFRTTIENDVDTPRALALMWKLLDDTDVAPQDIRATLLDFDQVLGLGLSDLKKAEIPTEILKLAQEREEARKAKNWAQSDVLRDQITAKGYSVKDTENGFVVNVL